MTMHPPIDDELAAGDFAPWLRELRETRAVGDGTDVACGTCTGCCTSAYFIHVGPDEIETLKRIPRALRVPAPGLPPGHVVLGYDARGHCPMLVDGACTIYAHRPRTCRQYDCRVFPAAGIAAGGEEKHAINRQIARWRFAYPSDGDRDAQAAVRAAVDFLRAHANAFPAGVVPSNPTQLAVLAIDAHELFLGPDRASDADTVAAIVTLLRRSERSTESAIERRQHP
jgi:Fe-S-cluster containining protein